MKSVLNQFFDRLTERLTGLLASLISSRFQNLQAVDLAEQQSELEERARRYEQEGKPEIAATLRQRAQCLAESDLASPGAQIIAAVTDVPLCIVDANPLPAASDFPDPNQLVPPKATRDSNSTDCISKRKPAGGNS